MGHNSVGVTNRCTVWSGFSEDINDAIDVRSVWVIFTLVIGGRGRVGAIWEQAMHVVHRGLSCSREYSCTAMAFFLFRVKVSIPLAVPCFGLARLHICWGCSAVNDSCTRSTCPYTITESLRGRIR